MSTSNIATLVQTEREFFLSFSRGSKPNDPYKSLQWAMAAAHGVLLEGFNVIYNKAESVPAADQEDFANFTLVWVQFLEEHHHFEDTVLFPAFEPKLVTPVKEEHDAFLGPLTELGTYLEGVLGLEHAGPGKTIPAAVEKPRLAYDGSKIKHLLDQMAQLMLSHLHNEITYLDPEKLRGCGITLEELQKQNQIQREHAKTLDATVSPVFVVICCHPDTHFPPAPTLVRKFIIPWVLYWKHSNWWRFAPDFNHLLS